MIKRNTVFQSVAATSLLALAACGGGASEAPATEETPEVEEVVEEEPAEEEVAAVPAVEPNGTVIEVEMLTRDPETGRQVFSPGLIRANVGDTIKIVPTNPGHNAATIDGMVPAGVEGFEGAIGEEVTFVVPAAGVYGYRCTPHYGAGMVGLIVVEGEGMTDNVEEAKGVSHPGLASSTFEELFAEAGV